MIYLDKNFLPQIVSHPSGVRSFISGREGNPPWSPFSAAWVGVRIVRHRLRTDVKCCKEGVRVVKDAVVKWNTAPTAQQLLPWANVGVWLFSGPGRRTVFCGMLLSCHPFVLLVCLLSHICRTPGRLLVRACRSQRWLWELTLCGRLGALAP